MMREDGADKRRNRIDQTLKFAACVGVVWGIITQYLSERCTTWPLSNLLASVLFLCSLEIGRRLTHVLAFSSIPILTGLACFFPASHCLKRRFGFRLGNAAAGLLSTFFIAPAVFGVVDLLCVFEPKRIP